ncbi:MAG: twin-arginine translocase subunit TatC [Thermodesulfovibrionales bacterium]|nr:twin-arginine translocase subunit TatC [Thermodesulfovibrionales bacterium]
MKDIKMPLTEHLSDLRKRIIISLIAVLTGFVAAFIYSEELFRFLTIPLKYDISFSTSSPFALMVEKKVKIPPLVFLAPAEAFWMHLKISMITGLIISLPVIFLQLWKFVSPGLLHKEKKYVIPFVIIATTFFLIGAAYCFFLVLPFAMGFLLTYKTESMTPMLSIGKYVDFCLKFILAFGAIFELPIAIIFSTRMGIVTPKTLAKNRKYAIILAFVVAAILTPTPDAFNQTLMAVPIIVLYEVGILVSRIFVRRGVA